MNFNRLRKHVLTFTMAGILTFSTLPANAALGDVVLQKGMQHEDVKELQQLLREHGYFHEEETTTYFGDVTYNAIIELLIISNLDSTYYSSKFSFGQKVYN